MKKYLLWMLVPMVLFACSDENEVNGSYEGNPDKGALVIRKAGVSEAIVVTRASADINTFTLVVQDENTPANFVRGLFSSFENGKVNNLTPSNYTVTLTSHPDGFTPAFDDPWYEAKEAGIAVEKAANTSITLEAVQANSGIRFVYGESLAKFGEIIPIISQKGVDLAYEGAKKEATGYFLNENAVLKIKRASDGEFLTIQNETEQTLELASEQLWEITLNGVQSVETGGIIISASVKVITEPNVFREFELGDPTTPGTDLITIVPPTAAEGTLRFTEADFQMFGENITAGRYGCFTKSSVDGILNDPANELTLEDLMQFNGRDISAEYLAALNSPEGWGITYIGLTPGVSYSFIIMPTKDGKQIAYRVDFTTLLPAGDFAQGEYSITVLGNMDGGYKNTIPSYTNYIPVTLAGDNFYNVGETDGLTYADCVFELPCVYEAVYQPQNNELVFTGYDTDGYYVLDDIAWYLENRSYFGAVVMFDEDGNHMVPHVWVTDAEHKAIKPKGSLYLMAYDVDTEAELGWYEKFEDGAVFSYTAPSSKKVTRSSSSLSGIERIQKTKTDNRVTEKPMTLKQ